MADIQNLNGPVSLPDEPLGLVEQNRLPLLASFGIWVLLSLTGWAVFILLAVALFQYIG
jgi:hypothetical protein